MAMFAPADRRVPYRPDIDQGCPAAQFGRGPAAEQEHGNDGEDHRHGEMMAP